MYLKELDQNKPIFPPFVRIELKLNRGGCQVAHVDSLAGLPDFLKSFRKRFGDAFYVARGVKHNATRTRAKLARSANLIARDAKFERKLERGFTQFGSMWCAKHSHKTSPDTRVNKRISDALNKLSIKLSKFKFAPKKQRRINRIAAEMRLMYQ